MPVAEKLDLSQRGRIVIEKRDPNNAIVELFCVVSLLHAEIEHHIPVEICNEILRNERGQSQQ